MVHLDDAERRRRLGVRHALAEPVGSAEEVAAAVVALHSTDPASMMLSALVRLADPSIAEVERALYEDRTLTRVLAMRRTVFAVPSDLAGMCVAACDRSVAASERRKLEKMVAASGIDDPAGFLADAHAAALTACARLDEFTSADLAAADPLLATRIEIGAGTKYATRQSIASRLLTVMSAEGHVVRVRPKGTWASTQFRWSAMDRWLPGLRADLTAAESQAEIVRRWLERFAPAPPEDLQWWTGWTKRETTAALAELPTVEVTTDDGPALVLEGDETATPDPGPWTALLPALDPTTMAWKCRDWYLGPHAEDVFDVNGNAGPTVWADGRIVGGWAIRDDGTVATKLLTDIGRERTDAVHAEAERVESLLGGTVLKARARGWTPVERQLRAAP